MKITAAMIRDAQPGWHPDERCPGLALLVKSTGRRVWCLDYRVNGRQRRLTLGRADVLLPGEAIKQAIKHRAAIDGGADPLALKEAARRAEEANITLTALFPRYLDEYAAVKKKPRSVAGDKWMFETVIKGSLGRLRVSDISDEDVARFHRKVSKSGTRGKPAPILANRAVALLSCVMSLAEKWKLRPNNSNPCQHVDKNTEHERHRFLSGEQLMALGKVLAESERAEPGTEEHEAPLMIAAIRLLLFTGCRKSEVLELRWSAVNFELGVLTLAESKTGAKVVTLNAPARQLLAGLPQTSEYVFPGKRAGKPLVGIGHVWERIRARAGLQGVRLHDLRHSFGSTAAGLGASLPIIGSLLGHSQAQTTARYAGVARDPRREAAEAVGKRLEGLLTPKPSKAVAIGAGRRGRR